MVDGETDLGEVLEKKMYVDVPARFQNFDFLCTFFHP